MIPRTLFSSEHELFRYTVRRFIAEHVAPHHAQWERDDMWEMPIARAWADARMTRIGGGGTEVMRQIIARSLLQQPPRRRDSALAKSE